MKTHKLQRMAGLVLLMALVAHSLNAQDPAWIELFDGSTLEGWEQHSGNAKYRVEDGCIVGQAVPNSPNSFLCTQKRFGNFILEFDVLLEDNELNSGVQFRSQVAPHELHFCFRNGEGEYSTMSIPEDRVYGYQVEIATSGAGGVYDEARRAMMPWWPERDSKEGRVFKPQKWNRYRVECQGDHVRTLVNGKVVSDFRDALSLEGIIGLQVHDVGDNTTPYQVRWKNIRIQVLD